MVETEEQYREEEETGERGKREWEREKDRDADSSHTVLFLKVLLTPKQIVGWGKQ